MFKKFLVSVLASASFGLSLTSLASNQPAGFDRWLQELRYELGDKGLTADVLDAALKDIQSVAPENVWDSLPDDRYVGHFVSPEMMAYARNVQQQYAPLLRSISQEYGVQERYLVALMTIEAAKYQAGNKYSVVDVLASKAFKGNDPHARIELENALKILQKNGLQKHQLVGDANGSFGIVGLKPSVFSRHAVDYDKNGSVDVWRPSADSLATVANALRELGWHGDQIWGREVTLPEGFDLSLIGTHEQRSLKKWSELGVRLLDGNTLPVAGMQASLVQPAGMSGRTYMIYDNFFTLLRWERSSKFALSVSLLSDALEQPTDIDVLPFAAAE